MAEYENTTQNKNWPDSLYTLNTENTDEYFTPFEDYRDEFKLIKDDPFRE